MNRRAILIIASLTAAVGAAVVATSGSAQAPTVRTMHLAGKTQKGVGFFPKHHPRQGDRIGFGETISGDETGTERAVCTGIGTDNGALCTVQFQLSKGTLTAQGIGHRTDTRAPFAITGGTGAYDGARGTALATDTSSTTSTIDITLLP